MFEKELARLNEFPEDAEETRLIEEICRKARADRDGTIRFLRSLDVQQRQPATHAIGLIESLSDCAEEWSDVFVAEFKRIAGVAAESSDSSEPIHVLESFAILEHEGAKPVHSRMLPAYLELARSPQPRLRQAAVELLAGFETNLLPRVRETLLAMLNDPDWRVRREAEWLLKDDGLLPRGYRTRILDRVRRVFKS